MKCNCKDMIASLSQITEGRSPQSAIPVPHMRDERVLPQAVSQRTIISDKQFRRTIQSPVPAKSKNSCRDFQIAPASIRFWDHKRNAFILISPKSSPARAGFFDLRGACGKRHLGIEVPIAIGIGHFWPSNLSRPSAAKA